MVSEYLNALKNKGNFTSAELSNLSGIPEATIRKILSGETADPRFETIAKLVASMGGSMDDIIGVKNEEEIEMNAIIAIKEAYESRIADIKEHINSLSNDKKILGTVAGVLMLFVIGILVLDLSIGSAGWVRY